MTDRSDQPPRKDETGEWFADGLRFECTQCGNCCTGPPGYVWFTEAEGRSMAEAMGETEARFLETYARKVRGHWTLNEQRTEHGYDCVFLDRETTPGKALCKVYRARPGQCRSWPFWPENLTSRADWELIKRTTPCPGMNTGPLVELTTIRSRMDQSSGEGESVE